MLILRLFSFLSFVLASITLLRPRSGWGRLGLFIPKLFAGTNITFIGLFGLLGAWSGYFLIQDPWSFGFGSLAALIALRHIARLVAQSLRLGREIVSIQPEIPEQTKPGMLPFPYIGFWKQPNQVDFRQNIQISAPPEIDFALLADLWLPADPGSRSGLGLIYLHGSGWHYADKDFGTRPFFRHLCGQGHVILDLAYTLAPKADLFRMMVDIKHTIAWMKDHAQDLGIDPGRIVLAGGSAGGHLALLAAYTPDHPRLTPPNLSQTPDVAAVISYYGPTDLLVQYRRFKELPGLTEKTRFERAFMRALVARFGFEPVPVHSLLPAFLGGGPEDVPELYSLGSPISHVSKACPPTLLLQGTHDFSGAATQVRRLYQALRDSAAPAFLYELPDCEHGFDLYKPGRSPAAQTATYVTERFLAGVMLKF